MKVPKQADTTAFKEPAVKPIKEGQCVSTVCKELGVSDQRTTPGFVEAPAFESGRQG